MPKIKSLLAIGLFITLTNSFSVLTAEAKQCFKKGAIGEAGSEKDAKFQVDEALLQAVDWGAWASWMANGTTPGYSFGPRTYRCSKGGSWGWTCRGQATICKL